MNDYSKRLASLSPDRKALLALRVAQEVGALKAELPYDKQLVAYVVLQDGNVASGSNFRSFLKGKLPEYMVPSSYVVLDALPLSPNGKVDRRALPVPGDAGAEAESEYVAPRNSVEEALAEIWSKLFRINRVGIHDNFFDLGGHSLLATQVASRIQSVLLVEIPLRAIFENPTVASLAVAILQIQAKQLDMGEAAVLLGRLESLSDEQVKQLLGK